MNKYKVKFKRVSTGYTELFADNEDQAVTKLYRQAPFILETENEEFDFFEPEIIS